MAITHCPECDEMTYDGTTLMGNPHRCSPKFEVLHDDDEGEWDRAQTVYAYDHDDAATKAAQQYDESMGEGPSRTRLLRQATRGFGGKEIRGRL